MNVNSLGLAYRARKLVVGTDITLSQLTKKKLCLIIIASDASDATKKKIYDKAKTYHVKVIDNVSSQELSEAIGKYGIKVIGVTDKGFGRLLLK